MYITNKDLNALYMYMYTNIFISLTLEEGLDQKQQTLLRDTRRDPWHISSPQILFYIHLHLISNVCEMCLSNSYHACIL